MHPRAVLTRGARAMPPSSRPNGVERVAQEGDTGTRDARSDTPGAPCRRAAAPLNLVRGLGKRPAAASPPLVMRMPWWSVRSASCAASEQILRKYGFAWGHAASLVRVTV